MRCTDPLTTPDSLPPGSSHRPDPRHVLGRLGEELAVAHLERCGFAIVDRNFRTRYGEIDIVAFDGSVIVFVEVKTRRATARRVPVTPLESLGSRQQARLRRLARAWLQKRPAGLHADVLRFDAIGILVSSDNRMIRLEHVESAW
jgi:putative endonuclease